MERYICIHGHFYQPPRENPWLEAVELQDSAYPYHDWNERVTAESYGPNASARILGPGSKIARLGNNYGRISFNFGPTLLSWMETGAPEVLQQVLEADKESQDRFGGHGSALAQAYNHLIMPLANRRDKVTQARWGIYAFQQRFGRRPEGMWLPETAVDLETLEVLAAEGILFTILAPYQAARFRTIEGEEKWHDVTGGQIDPSRAYQALLPSGQTINLFFYDGPVSRAVAFEHLLNNGETFANRLTNIFSPDRDWPQLAHIATDGETYGHHHRYGEMALARALDFIEEQSLARLINYGQYLELCPPQHQVEIYENTSWSCPHGVERWRSNCGCNSGGHPGWNQEWRTPLRETVDWLRDQLAHCYEENGQTLFHDCWAARDDYIKVLLDRSTESVDSFLKQHTTHELDEGEQVRALKFMELQRHAMLMYTSCGWFFDELSGIETVQVIQYAARALQLAQELGVDHELETNFLKRLAQAHSNIPANGDGRQVYEKLVRGAMVDLPKVAAHYALTSLFRPYPHATQIYCYQASSENYERDDFGRAKLATGQVRIESEVTHETGRFHFAALHFGDQNLICGVDQGGRDKEQESFLQEAQDSFQHNDLPQVVQIMDRHFGELPYTLRTMFRDEQRRTLAQVLEPILTEMESVYSRMYDQYMPLMRFITNLNSPLPAVFQPVPAIALNSALRQELEADELNVEKIKGLLRSAQEIGITLDGASLGYSLRTTLERLAARFRDAPDDIIFLRQLATAVVVARSMPFEVGLDRAQDIYYRAQQEVLPHVKEVADKGDPSAWFWVDLFLYTGDQLGFRVRDD